MNLCSHLYIYLHIVLEFNSERATILLPYAYFSSSLCIFQLLDCIRKVGVRLLASIGFLHQQNFIHTDLKPENILLKHGKYTQLSFIT